MKVARAYYNENDPKAAEWLRHLIAANLVAPGDVDERSIVDVQASDLAGYTQCHFFAGIGGWSHALRLAEWPDDRPVWTGSCPCQPFSAAGRGKAEADARHLWPEYARLIGERHPAKVFGEQVASKLGRRWLADVQAEMEEMGYAFGSADLCAAGVGAPHIRQRLWFVGERLADGAATGHERRGSSQEGDGRNPARQQPERLCDVGGLEYGVKSGLEGQRGHGDGSHEPGRIEADPARPAPETGGFSGLADGNGGVTGEAGTERVQPGGEHRQQPEDCGFSEQPATGAPDGFWRDADWLFCRDGKWRPVEPGTFPLAHGVPERVGLLRGFGNAIVPQVAAAFIKAATSP